MENGNGHHQNLNKLSFAGLLVALGIVFGDIGTSPLYTFAAIVGEREITETLALGGLSAVFWTLTLQTTIKYISIVLSADNNGEGGVFSLYTLIYEKAGKWILYPTIIGGSFILAEGIITRFALARIGLFGFAGFKSDLGLSSPGRISGRLLAFGRGFSLHDRRRSAVFGYGTRRADEHSLQLDLRENLSDFVICRASRIFDTSRRLENGRLDAVLCDRAARIFAGCHRRRDRRRDYSQPSLDFRRVYLDRRSDSAAFLVSPAHRLPDRL
jgi:hypothetical protein